MIARGGIPCPLWDTPIHIILNPAQRQCNIIEPWDLEQLDKAGIHTMGDIIDNSTNTPTLIPLHQLVAPRRIWRTDMKQGTQIQSIEWLRQYVTDFLPEIPKGTRTITGAQHWALTHSHNKIIGERVFSVAGIDTTTGVATIIIWEQIRGSKRRFHNRKSLRTPSQGDTYRQMSPQRGAGSDTTIHVTELFPPGQRCIKVLFTPPYKDNYNTTSRSYPIIARKVVYAHRVADPPVPQPPPRGKPSRNSLPIMQMCSRIQREKLPTWEAYTDGAFIKTTSDLNEILGIDRDCKSSGGAAVVFISPSEEWHRKPLHILQIDTTDKWHTTSVFPFELLAIVLAEVIGAITHTPLTIRSDSQASIGALVQPTMHKQSRLKAGLFLQQASKTIGELSRIKHTISHVYGHPERRQPDDTLWTRDMWGNHVADIIAGGNTLPCGKPYSDNALTTITHISVNESIWFLQEYTNYYIADVSQGYRDALIEDADDPSIYPHPSGPKRHSINSSISQVPGQTARRHNSRL